MKLFTDKLKLALVTLFLSECLLILALLLRQPIGVLAFFVVSLVLIFALSVRIKTVREWSRVFTWSINPIIIFPGAILVGQFFLLQILQFKNPDATLPVAEYFDLLLPYSAIFFIAFICVHLLGTIASSAITAYKKSQMKRLSGDQSA